LYFGLAFRRRKLSLSCTQNRHLPTALTIGQAIPTIVDLPNGKSVNKLELEVPVARLRLAIWSANFTHSLSPPVGSDR
jgi:hypothetical protein